MTVLQLFINGQQLDSIQFQLPNYSYMDTEKRFIWREKLINQKMNELKSNNHKRIFNAGNTYEIIMITPSKLDCNYEDSLKIA